MDYCSHQWTGKGYVAQVTQASIGNYWRRYWRRTLFFVITMQIVVVAIVTGALLLSDVGSLTSPIFWIIVFAMLVASVVMNIFVFSIASEPLKQLVASLAQADGERPLIKPPNPNTERYEKNGFKPLLQLIYKFGASDSVPAKVAKPSEKTEKSPPGLTEALDQTSAGVVIFGQDGKITYHNSKAPIHEGPDGDTQLDLFFSTDTPFEDWLKDCDTNAVHAEKTWLHIPTNAEITDERKIYDISASYNKGSDALVVMVLFEKTDQYMPEDRDLDFIAFAAHELRGPITVIRGYLDVLGDELGEALKDDQKELLGRLVVSANRLSGYINNILNASRYDRRHLNVHLTETSLQDVYSTIADDMVMRASSQNRLLSVQFPPDLPTIAADTGSLSEVIGNLIDNAIKYSNEGGSIEVTAQALPEFVQVSVVDHGIGMPANVVGNLFHKFYRSHRSRETVAGTGIGLYISKAIVESHGGTMNVQSIEGAGSTFSFTVPTYASVASKLAETGGDNKTIIEQQPAGWIKNHGSFRG